MWRLRRGLRAGCGGRLFGMGRDTRAITLDASHAIFPSFPKDTHKPSMQWRRRSGVSEVGVCTDDCVDDMLNRGDARDAVPR